LRLYKNSNVWIFVSHTPLLVSLQPLQDSVRGMIKEDENGGDFARRMANTGRGVEDGTDYSSFPIGHVVDSSLKVAEISGNDVNAGVGVGVNLDLDLDGEYQVGSIVFFVVYHSIQMHSSCLVVSTCISHHFLSVARHAPYAWVYWPMYGGCIWK
jgi:hypothetical protein